MDDGAGKTGKASGMKIEYSMSDEIVFAQKLSAIMRKKLMNQLMQDEKEMYHQELNSIGLLHSHDTVSENIRKCGRDLLNKPQKYFHSAQQSNLSKLFKTY